MEIKKVLVTGSEGYIGKVLVKKLMDKGYFAVGLDTNYYMDEDPTRYKFLHQDIRKLDNISLTNFDAIIHLAALSNDPIGAIDPTLTEEINGKASIRLAQRAKKTGVKRFLFSSSCSIYGIAKEDEVNEESDVNPLTAYARSKKQVEDALLDLSCETFCTGILRNSTVYGYSPNFRDDLVVNNLMACAFVTGELRIMSDGTPWRPLIDVRDLSDIFVEFLNVDPKKINGSVFNIGFNDSNFQVKDIINLIQKEIPECKVVYTGEHGADSRSYKVRFNKFQQVFPHIVQNWPLPKSIHDLRLQLKKIHFSLGDFDQMKYSRLTKIKKLLQDKKIDNKLFWL